MSILSATETSPLPLPELRAISNIRKRTSVSDIEPPNIKKQRKSKTSRVALAILTDQPSSSKQEVADFADKRKKNTWNSFSSDINKENKPSTLQIVELTSSFETHRQEKGEISDDEGLKEAMRGRFLEDEGKIDEAIAHYKASVVLGNPRGEAYLGIYNLEKVLNNGGHRKGFELIKSSALKNDPLGQAYLGYCYLKGYGTLPSTDRARYYCNLSAEQGEKKGIEFRELCLKKFGELRLKQP